MNNSNDKKNSYTHTGRQTSSHKRRFLTKKNITNTFLIEVAWEVCNQVGGIYTVIRSKIPAISKRWQDNYCLIGPYIHPNVTAIFDEEERAKDPKDPIHLAVANLKNRGIEVHYGRWLVLGRPKVVLFNPFSVFKHLNKIKHNLLTNHNIPIPNQRDDLFDQVTAFSFLVTTFFKELAHIDKKKHNIIAHFHEWMAGVAIPTIRKDKVPLSIVFTTHATLLGRFLAQNDQSFYQNLALYNHEKESQHFNIEPSVKIERAATHGSHVFTTVSPVTGNECEHLLGRKPDLTLPNGLNIDRFSVFHEFQNLHLQYKLKINHFIMGHFFQSYSFDLEDTIYLFISGRFEYQNKGFDLTLEALARLNWRLKEENNTKTVVAFFITKQPVHSINPNVLQSRAIMEEINQTCGAIQNQVGERLFDATASRSDHRLPDLNNFVDDYWRLRLRRTVQSWKSDQLPPIVTHNLINDRNDEILNFLRRADLINKESDRVKIVYHPDFINPTSPLFGMDYGQFVRGCHLGVFPSFYEPWGYTPLECIASGLPAITTDLSGFGDYIIKNVPEYHKKGIYVIKRQNKSFDEAANQLTDQLYSFAHLNRRERIALRNRVESFSVEFSWNNLVKHYEKAYSIALKRFL